MNVVQSLTLTSYAFRERDSRWSETRTNAFHPFFLLGLYFHIISVTPKQKVLTDVFMKGSLPDLCILKDVNPVKIMLIMYCYMSIISISICNQLLNGIFFIEVLNVLLAGM